MKNVNETSSVEYASVATQHHYNGDVFPQIVVNNTQCKTVAETVAFVKANQAELEAKLAKAGALLFRGFPIDSAEAFDVFSAGFNYPISRIKSRCLTRFALTLQSEYLPLTKRQKT